MELISQASAAHTLPIDSALQRNRSRQFLGGILTLLKSRRIVHVDREIQRRLAERISERKRIVRELHDTLFQDFQSVILRLSSAVRALSIEDPARISIEEVLNRADDMVKSSRYRVEELRDTGWDGDTLVTKLQRTCAELRFACSAELSVEDRSASVGLNPVVRDELFLICKEALMNAARHSRSSRIACTLSRQPEWIEIQCIDNGCGISRELGRTHRASPHFGLGTMRERSALLGAHFHIQSSSSLGTQVIVRVPTEIAYSTLSRLV